MSVWKGWAVLDLGILRNMKHIYSVHKSSVWLVHTKGKAGRSSGAFQEYGGIIKMTF